MFTTKGLLRILNLYLLKEFNGEASPYGKEGDLFAIRGFLSLGEEKEFYLVDTIDSSGFSTFSETILVEVESGRVDSLLSSEGEGYASIYSGFRTILDSIEKENSY